MNDEFRILFVDDEQTFLDSTADLLRREGYGCDSISDVADAARLLQEHSYQLLIADIKMPGNSDLEFVRRLAAETHDLSIILVTGHPSLASALQGVELRVVAYLVKPFDFHDLLAKVRAVAQFSQVLGMVRKELARLEQHQHALRHVEHSMQHLPRNSNSQSWHALVTITLGNIVGALSNLNQVVNQAEQGRGQEIAVPALAAQTADLRGVLGETVAILERTKTSFKSKELRDLRRRLEGLLNP